MSSAVELYEALTSAPDDRTRARLIAEAFERLEERYPHLPELATQGHVSDSEQRLQTDIKTAELRLQKEIEQVRAELRETELRLKKEIKTVELRLQKEIKTVALTLRKEIEQVRADIARSKNDMLKWLVPLMFAQVAAIAALVKLL